MKINLFNESIMPDFNGAIVGDVPSGCKLVIELADPPSKGLSAFAIFDANDKMVSGIVIPKGYNKIVVEH